MAITVGAQYSKGMLGPVICSDEDYFADEGINCSGLKTIKQKSPYHWHMYDRVSFDKDTEAKRIGTLIHAMALGTPSLEEFEYFDGASLTSKKALDFIEALKKKHTEDGTPVPRVMLERELTSATKIYKYAREQNSLLEDLQVVANYKEIACFISRHGYRAKAKADALWLPSDPDVDGIIWDLKTTNDLFDFAKSARKYAYHMQDNWYRDIFQNAFKKRFQYRLVVVEKNYPYSVVWYEFSDRVLNQGRQWIDEAFAQYCVGADTGVWRKPESKIVLDWRY